jgi:hypothetical protein
MYRRNRRNLLLGGAVAVASFVGYATVALAHDTSSAGDRSTGVYALTDDEVNAIRDWATPFASSDDAVASGRVDLDLCFDHMGDHFADPASFGDGVLDPVKPEALVYADVDGTSQLVAVEWVSTQPGEVLGIPLHLNHDLDVWVLHAWVGLDNPMGMLADHNPDVGTCPA